MKCFHKNKYSLDSYALRYAIISGNLESMKQLSKNGFSKSGSSASTFATGNSNLENMKWLLKNNFSYDKDTFVYADSNGNLENMKW